MLLAIALSDQRLRGKRIYRSLLILPYAMPGFISIIVWRGLFNPRFGKVSELLDPLLGIFGASSPPWLADPFWAKVAILVVSTWLTFPYMFLITTGALTAIPAELIEAARVDGARGIDGLSQGHISTTDGGDRTTSDRVVRGQLQ